MYGLELFSWGHNRKAESLSWAQPRIVIVQSQCQASSYMQPWVVNCFFPAERIEKNSDSIRSLKTPCRWKVIKHAHQLGDMVTVNQGWYSASGWKVHE